MTINTQMLRDLAGDLETYNVMSRYPQGLLDAADALDSQTAEIARLREALLWTAGALQMACKVDVTMGEADGISINNETRTVAQILDAADAAIQEKSHD